MAPPPLAAFVWLESFYRGEEKEEKRGRKGHLGEEGEVNGTQSILLIIGSMVLLYGGCEQARPVQGS